MTRAGSSGARRCLADASSKLAMVEKLEQAERLALLDTLTGVGKRRYAEAALTERVDLFLRTGEVYQPGIGVCPRN